MKNYEIGSMNWDADIETILKAFVQDFSEILEGTEYYVVRNSTINEKCVNLMRKGIPYRVGHIWPKRRLQCVDVCLMKDLIQKIGSRIELPERRPEEKERSNDWNCFPHISYEKTYEVIKALAAN